MRSPRASPCLRATRHRPYRSEPPPPKPPRRSGNLSGHHSFRGDGKWSCGCSSMVEHQLPKLTARVRFPSPAPLRSASFAPWVLRFASHPDASEAYLGAGPCSFWGPGPQTPTPRGSAPGPPARFPAWLRGNWWRAALLGADLFGAVSGVRGWGAGALPTHPPCFQRCAAASAAFHSASTRPRLRSSGRGPESSAAPPTTDPVPDSRTRCRLGAMLDASRLTSGALRR